MLIGQNYSKQQFVDQCFVLAKVIGHLQIIRKCKGNGKIWPKSSKQTSAKRGAKSMSPSLSMMLVAAWCKLCCKLGKKYCIKISLSLFLHFVLPPIPGKALGQIAQHQGEDIVEAPILRGLMVAEFVAKPKNRRSGK
jgi:hypothetical protein